MMLIPNTCMYVCTPTWTSAWHTPNCSVVWCWCCGYQWWVSLTSCCSVCWAKVHLVPAVAPGNTASLVAPKAVVLGFQRHFVDMSAFCVRLKNILLLRILQPVWFLQCLIIMTVWCILGWAWDLQGSWVILKSHFLMIYEWRSSWQLWQFRTTVMYIVLTHFSWPLLPPGAG